MTMISGINMFVRGDKCVGLQLYREVPGRKMPGQWTVYQEIKAGNLMVGAFQNVMNYKRSMKKNSQNQMGFTLIELMVTVAVLVIVMMIGVPSILQLKRNNQLVTYTNSIVTTLNLAKSEAVRQGLPVGVQQIVAGEWVKGWNVVLPDATVFRTFKGSVEAGEVFDAAKHVLIAKNNTAVVFQALGDANASCFDVQVPLNDDAGTTVDRSVTVNNMGRISTCRDTCAAVAGDPTLCH
ncbi:MAG: GspH/FimT family pseudopilin [Candidatus Sedimenticola sp. 1PA]